MHHDNCVVSVACTMHRVYKMSAEHLVKRVPHTHKLCNTSLICITCQAQCSVYCRAVLTFTVVSSKLLVMLFQDLYTASVVQYCKVAQQRQVSVDVTHGPLQL
eukprot:14551-Heterococcus_DN1.PRE.3